MNTNEIEQFIDFLRKHLHEVALNYFRETGEREGFEVGKGDSYMGLTDIMLEQRR